MAYEGISHARSHRVPFAGLGRAPGYMGNYGASGFDGLSGASNTAAAITAGAQTIATITDVASGGPQKRERESRRNLEIARLQAQAASGNAQAQIEVARLQAEAAVAAARVAGQSRGMSKTAIIAIAGVAGVALLGGIGYMLLKK